ncbi:hypothetical protein BAE44_0001476 [Dichanthelium oligosanthes]|uniref:Uncharacterized protein n=1 Tax=Dichanthelium oligosanthes TaxID=888268 RepID=A0A1E5WJE4_9POAL|nr:hypothetical protein BAE44_0001476 [Dichanthelium oligosanthes]
MAKIKPKALLAQSKVKKGPNQIGVTTVFTYLVLSIIVVSSIYAAYKYWPSKQNMDKLYLAKVVSSIWVPLLEAWNYLKFVMVLGAVLASWDLLQVVGNTGKMQYSLMFTMAVERIGNFSVHKA